MSYSDLPLWIQFLLTCEDHLMSGLILLIWLCSLFYMPSAKQLLKKLAPLPLMALASAAVNWLAAGIIQNVPLMLLIYLLIALLFTLWSMWVWHCLFWHALAAVCIAEMMEISLSVIFIRLLYLCFPMAAPEHVSAFTTMCLPWLTLLPLHFAFSAALGRLWPKERFCTYPEHAGAPRRRALLLSALTAAFVVLSHMEYGMDPRYLAEYLLVCAAMALLAVALILHLALRREDQRRLQLQKDMLTRQRLYEQTLEDLQKELRTFRHDCQNLLTGLADSREEGTLSRSLKELETGFEKRLGEKIHLASQIGNLCIPQVRGMLLGKLSQMAEKNIPCRLEVLYPVTHAAMDTWDLVRCLGILTDNAMEAAQETENPWVEILLLQEDASLSLRISNPWLETSNPEYFWKEGWSTRGRGRGMGLLSYQKILKKYPGASSAARWSGKIFTQELTIV
mgnify:CR=1 FL=1